jgi:glutaredoxin
VRSRTIGPRPGLRVERRRALGIALALGSLLGAACAGRGLRAITAADPVIVYGAWWCAHSRAAQVYLSRRHVPYRFVDVTRDGEARDTLAARLREFGMSPGPIPVLDVGGQLLVGFDANELERTIAGRY